MVFKEVCFVLSESFNALKTGLLLMSSKEDVEMALRSIYDILVVCDGVITLATRHCLIVVIEFMLVKRIILVF